MPARCSPRRRRSALRLALPVALPVSLMALLVVVVAAACAGAPDPERPSTLVILSLDTLRRDHLPVYGYERDTAPTLSALAERAVVFDRAYAQDTNTNPSHTSMLTGLYPHTHGNLRNGSLLRSGVVTLAEVLSEAGFATGAFVSSAPMHRATTGLDRGFDVYDDELADEARVFGRFTVERATRWLSGWRASPRTFLFVHLFDPHGPYIPPDGFADAFGPSAPGPTLEHIPEYQQQLDADGELIRDLAWYVDRYDTMIRYADARVRELLDHVDLEDAIVVVLSDHGESLGERFRKLDHGGSVYDEQIRIPLLLAAPALEPRRVAAPVESVDLVPTLLDLLGVEPPPELRVQGQSLAAMLRSGTDGDLGRPVFSSARTESNRFVDRPYLVDTRQRIASIRSPRWKLVAIPGQSQSYLELFDLEADPGETENVHDRHPQVARAHLEALQRWRANAVDPSPSALSPELRERLRELGYGD